jgi:hypothetical protein
LAKIAENCDHNIDPSFQWKADLPVSLEQRLTGFDGMQIYRFCWNRNLPVFVEDDSVAVLGVEPARDPHHGLESI